MVIEVHHFRIHVLIASCVKFHLSVTHDKLVIYYSKDNSQSDQVRQ